MPWYISAKQYEISIFTQKEEEENEEEKKDEEKEVEEKKGKKQVDKNAKEKKEKNNKGKPEEEEKKVKPEPGMTINLKGDKSETGDRPVVTTDETGRLLSGQVIQIYH